MGNIIAWLGWGPVSSPSHAIHVRTGDHHGAGTDANVWIVLRDRDGTASAEIKLNNWLKNDHERGNVSSFDAFDLHDLEHVAEIELWRDEFGMYDAWFVDKIEIHSYKPHGPRNYFPVQRWIKPHVRYVLREFDCCLPKYSHDREERRAEMAEMRTLYKYKQNVPDGPAQIEVLPYDEKFSSVYMIDLQFKKVKLFIEKNYLALTRNNFQTIEDVKDVYRHAFIALERMPYSLESWDTDLWFGLQRVQGCNAVLIRLCTHIPEKFGVTEEMILRFLEGLTLAEALKANRLFYVDLEILEDLECKDRRTVCAPFALFFLDKSKNLMPIAIQLFQDKGPKNPVFLPTDPKYTWLLAKMYYNNADAIFHQAYTHLGFTHLIMEGVAICTHRNLSPSHPLFRLLAPHFLYLLAINTRGLEKLVSVNGWVDRTMTCGRCGMFALINRGLHRWTLNGNGNIPKEIESRGVQDPAILPHYPYRDDATAIFKAIHTYVSAIVHHYYPSDSEILSDEELQAWRRELVLERGENGGVGMLGVSGENNQFTTAAQVVDVMTSIISVCSIGHAAANFQQYDEYAFTPNYPALLSGKIPCDKTELTEADVVSHLPDKTQTLDIMTITNLLSQKGTRSLGDFEVQYLYDPADMQAAEDFRAALKKISSMVQDRNAELEYTYEWLDPKIVPNAISI